MKCPVCNTNELHPDEVMNALSRKDNKTYICSNCSIREAMEELEEIELEEERPYSNVKDIIFCRNPKTAGELREFYMSKGYGILQSTVEIESGTHGKHIVIRLDIMDSIKL